MLRKLKRLKQKSRYVATSAFTAVCTFYIMAGNAMAALSIDQQAAVDAIDTMIDDMIVVGWGLITLTIGFTAGSKIFKKFVGKSI